MKRNCSILFFIAAALRLSAQIEVVSGGNVGIGTTSPANKLSVEGTGDVASFGSSAKKLYFAPDSNGVGLFTGASQAGTGFYANAASNYFSISTNSAEKMRVDSSGNVGIGTTAPAAALHVLGNVGREVARFQGSTDVSNNRNFVSLYTTNPGFWWEISNQDAIGGGTSNNIAFRERSGTGSSIERVYLAAGGNVGIGTNSPGTKLEIKGDELRVRAIVSKTDTTGRGLLRLTSDDNVGATNLEMKFSLFGAASGGSRYGQIQVGDNGYYWATLALNPYGGKVGIGTSTPSSALQVAGDVRATSFISDTTTYADFVFKPDYVLPALSEIEAHIQKEGHLPGIPSEAEARAHGIDLAAMQVKLLQKVEELTLHVIAQEKQFKRLQSENTTLRQRLEQLEGDYSP